MILHILVNKSTYIRKKNFFVKKKFQLKNSKKNFLRKVSFLHLISWAFEIKIKREKKNFIYVLVFAHLNCSKNNFFQKKFHSKNVIWFYAEEIFYRNSNEPKKFETGRIRTYNLLIRSQTRYPLRHSPLFLSDFVILIWKKSSNAFTYYINWFQI